MAPTAVYTCKLYFHRDPEATPRLLDAYVELAIVMYVVNMHLYKAIYNHAMRGLYS